MTFCKSEIRNVVVVSRQFNTIVDYNSREESDVADSNKTNKLSTVTRTDL